jgi:hypothetical protein
MFKKINQALILLGYLPLIYLIVYYAYVLRAIIKIGKIPTYGNPDPKELGFDTHRWLIYFLFDVVVYGVLIYIVLLCVTLYQKKFTVRKIHLYIFIISIFIFFLAIFMDPFDEWFLD